MKRNQVPLISSMQSLPLPGNQGSYQQGNNIANPNEKRTSSEQQKGVGEGDAERQNENISTQDSDRNPDCGAPTKVNLLNVSTRNPALSEISGQRSPRSVYSKSSVALDILADFSANSLPYTAPEVIFTSTSLSSLSSSRFCHYHDHQVDPFLLFIFIVVTHLSSSVLIIVLKLNSFLNFLS